MVRIGSDAVELLQFYPIKYGSLPPSRLLEMHFDHMVVKKVQLFRRVKNFVPIGQLVYCGLTILAFLAGISLFRVVLTKI